MNTQKTVLAAFILAMAAAVGGCSADAAPEKDTNTASPEVVQQLSDAAVQGKLRGILTDVTFTSEGDYPYVVFEGEAATGDALDESLVREKLAAAVLANSGDGRDIKPASCRAELLDIDRAIADGDAAEVPSDPSDDEYVYARHDKQLSIALKTMRSQLKSVVGFTFGTNESGDQDELGTVLYVYVGISKTTGKLIAIMTEAVYT
ncbi:MAG: hypothetical protein KIS78_12350 [Labilithrix sp.]|nr:hypothetical protein [Labilithrix sp.]MCW5833184.1 hypothetical protein [Labilithrix sp.]